MRHIIVLAKNNLISLLLILFFTTGIFTLNNDLPYYYADEFKVVDRALTIPVNGVDFFEWPPIVNYMNTAVFGLYYIAGKISGKFNSVDDFTDHYILYPYDFYLLSRILNVLISLLGFYFFLILIKEIFKGKHLILAGISYILPLSIQQNLHLSILDMPLLTVMNIMLYTTYKKEKNWYFISCIITAIAFSVKYNGLAFFLIPFSLKLEQILKGELSIKKFVLDMLIAVFTILTVIILINPFILIRFKLFIREFFWVWRIVLTDNIMENRLADIGLTILTSFGVIGFVFGLFALLKQLIKKEFVFSIFPLLYLLYVLSWGQFYPRYLLPLIPFFIIGFLMLTQNTRHFKTLIAINLTILIPFFILFFINNSRDSISVQATKWIEHNIDPGGKIAFTPATVHLKPNMAQLKSQYEFRKSAGFSGNRWQTLIDNYDIYSPNYELCYIIIPRENEFVWECGKGNIIDNEIRYFVLLEKYPKEQYNEIINMIGDDHKKIKEFYNPLNKKRLIIYERN